jgi:RNA recognition motif-containing protein
VGNIGSATADVYVPFEPETKAMRGFAFVTFTDSRDAFAAVDAMDGHAALQQPAATEQHQLHLYICCQPAIPTRAAASASIIQCHLLSAQHGSH